MVAVAGVGVGCGLLLTGQARAGVMPIFVRHSEVCTGALKKVAGLTETVPVGTVALLLSPVSVPSSSLSSVWRSISVKPVNMPVG